MSNIHNRNKDNSMSLDDVTNILDRARAGKSVTTEEEEIIKNLFRDSLGEITDILNKNKAA